MTIWWLILILAALGSAGIAFIWLIVTMNRGRVTRTPQGLPVESLADQAVEHIFDATFREELRNRGRLHFENIIGENAMFLQQDLRLSTSEVNAFMKTEITSKLKEEFDKYQQSIMDAKQTAIDSIQKTNVAIDEQRQALGEELKQEVAAEKLQIIEHFEANMGDIVNHYVLAAVGDQIDLSDQLEYILGELEKNKQTIIEDIKNGA